MYPDLLSLIIFGLVTSLTPGPNNITASYSGFNFGIIKTLPHIFGVTLGFTSLVLFLTIGLINVFKFYPFLQKLLTIFRGINLEYFDSAKIKTDDELKKLETAGAKAFIESDVKDVETALTEEQIEDRQKFYKQCALLMNMSTLSPKFDQKIIARQKSPAFDGPSKNQPYGGRFYMATSNNKEALITNLVSSIK